MSEPTPGPWFLDLNTFPDGGYAYVEAHTRRVALVDEAIKADLYLIAAAPDLLEALLAFEEEDFGSNGWTRFLESAARKARAAIKKATGEE